MTEGEKRAKYLRLGERLGERLGGCGADNDNAPAVTLTRAELGALVRASVEEALEARGERHAAPALLDREGLARAIGCSSSLVDKLRRRGMPSVRLGDSPRFELEACLGWIRKEGAA